MHTGRWPRPAKVTQVDNRVEPGGKVATGPKRPGRIGDGRRAVAVARHLADLGRYDTRRMPLNAVNAKSDASEQCHVLPSSQEMRLDWRRVIPRTTSYRGASPDRVMAVQATADDPTRAGDPGCSFAAFFTMSTRAARTKTSFPLTVRDLSTSRRVPHHGRKVLVSGRLVRFNDRTGAARPHPRHGPPVRPR